MPLFDKPYVIADIGSNHRGSVDLATRQIEAAAQCGVGAVKFQLYSHEELYGYAGDCAGVLPRNSLGELKAAADAHGVDFMCTAFSPGGVGVVDPFVKFHKVASSEMKYVHLLDAVKATGKPWFVSTGGAHWTEVEAVVALYKPTYVLECVAAYPADAKDYVVYTDVRGTPVGLSDHTLTSQIAMRYAQRRARVFEKHFDAFSELGATPDSPVSINPIRMGHYVRDVLTTFDTTQWTPAHEKHTRVCERPMTLKWRRRLKATRDIAPGETLKYGDNFGSYRSKDDDVHAWGPEMWDKIEGKRAKHAIAAFKGIFHNDVE